MDKIQLLFKKIIPALIVILILAPVIYSAYVSIYLKTKLTMLDRQFDELSKGTPVKNEIKYNRFEEDEKYKTTVAKLDSIENQIKRRLPAMNNFGVLADRIQALAAECNVDVAGLNVFNPSREAGLDIYPMKINLECRSTYKAFKKFLWGLENCDNMVFIEKINIASKMSDEKFHYSYELMSYIKKQ